MTVGDLIGIEPVSNTHGCRDYAIAQITSIKDNEVIGKVTEAQSCHSCWQLGHDHDHVFARVGELMTFDKSTLVLAGDDCDFVTDVKWIKP